MHTVARARLPNGLRVVTIRRPHIHRLVLSAYIEVGSRHETRRTNGLSHFLEHMLFRGTSAQPNAHMLNEAIESLGGSLSAATHGDYTLFDLTVPPRALASACDLIGSIFMRPVFSQIEIEKGIVREEILETLDDDNRESDPDNLLRAQVFRNHPLGYPITGTLRNVERFTLRDLQKQLNTFYTAPNMVIVVCSPLHHREVMKAVSHGFGHLPTPQSPVASPARVTQRRGCFKAWSGAGSQTSVRLGFPTPGGISPSARALEMLIRVLDDGMSTRLHHRICDELGLAYEVSASVELFRDVGVLEISSSVAHRSVGRLVDEVLTMLADLAQYGPSHAEIEKAQHRYGFDLAALDDDPHGLSDFYGTAALWNREVSVSQRRMEIEALTPHDIRRAARLAFAPSRLNLMLMGANDSATTQAIRASLRRFRQRSSRIDPQLPVLAPHARATPRKVALTRLDSAAASF